MAAVKKNFIKCLLLIGKNKRVKNIKIEVFLGEYDKILSLKKAQSFFKNYATVYCIKKANHFLRSEIGY